MFKCIECEYYSQRCYNIKRHMLIKHNITILCKEITFPEDIIFDPKPIIFDPKPIISDPKPIISDPNVINKNQCEQCGKVYSSKSNLTKHLLICKGSINNKECKFCKKKLSSNQSKTIHLLTCKEKDKQIIINNITNNDNSVKIDNSTNITNNITINNFGNENLTYISDEMLQALTDNVDARGMIDVIYFNDSHPENHNIELYSNKKQLYKIYKNNSFSNVMNIDLAHSQMICKMVKLFMDKILEEEDIDQKNSKLHNLHYYNKTKSETVKLLSKHIYSQILSRTLQKIEL
jgi:hypothetical protein